MAKVTYLSGGITSKRGRVAFNVGSLDIVELGCKIKDRSILIKDIIAFIDKTLKYCYIDRSYNL